MYNSSVNRNISDLYASQNDRYNYYPSTSTVNRATSRGKSVNPTNPLNVN